PLVTIPQFGVDPSIYHPPATKPDGPPVIGYAGRLVPEKGVDLLLDAFARLETRARLEIVGSGSERINLEMRAGQLGVRDRVVFRGALAPAAMPEVLGGFDLLAIPSL